MRSWLMVLLCFASNMCFAQTNTLSGVVQDSLDNPIPYATVVEQHGRAGEIANSVGYFTIIIPDSLMNSVITISCLGYESKQVTISTLKSDMTNTIVLREKTVVLTPVSVVALQTRYCPDVVGTKKKRAFGNFLMKAGWEMAVLIPTTLADTGFISAVRYYITKEGVPTAPFRVKLYDVDPVTQQPGNILLDHDTIVHAVKGGQWLEVDLRSFNIPIPANGFFVAMQWLPTAEEYSKTLGDRTIIANGQAVGLYRDDTRIHYVRDMTHDWFCFNQIAAQHPMFGAVLSKECK